MKSDRTIHEVQKHEAPRWDSLVSHPLQSWGWGEFRSAMGIDVLRLGLYENNILIECWQLTFHSIPHTGLTVGYFPKGPLPTEEMIRALQSVGRKKHAIYIQLEPNCEINKMGNNHLAELIPSHHPLFTRYTFLLDLTKKEDELLAQMHPKTRYNIKVAQKHTVLVKEDNSDSAFAEYLKLSKETTQRQGFFAHNRKYQETMWKTMKKNNISKLWSASYNNQTLASWILFLWKDTMYYPYGASSRDHRETMAPNLLLWEIMKWGKRNGFSRFDLWGALGPTPDIHDPWYGFHRFKQGYNPTLIEFGGSYDLIVSPILYRIYCFLDSVRWMLLNRSWKK